MCVCVHALWSQGQPIPIFFFFIPIAHIPYSAYLCMHTLIWQPPDALFSSLPPPFFLETKVLISCTTVVYSVFKYLHTQEGPKISVVEALMISPAKEKPTVNSYQLQKHRLGRWYQVRDELLLLC